MSTGSLVITEIHMEVTGSKSCLSLRDSFKRNSNYITRLSEVMQLNGVVDDTTGCRIIPEIDMAGNQTYVPAEIVLLPVWAAAVCISGITRLPVTLFTTPLNNWTSKTWVAVGILLLCALELEMM